jgi:hypothetical protein
VPDYLITIHMTIGNPKSGLRWHSSYDIDHVKALIEAKVRKVLGKAAVKWVDVELVVRKTDTRMDTKNLNL